MPIEIPITNINLITSFICLVISVFCYITEKDTAMYYFGILSIFNLLLVAIKPIWWPSLKVRIANITSSTIDGIGISLVVFFQGCFHNCDGCQNPSLQDPNNGYEYDTKDIISELQANADFYDSIVLTGGDPLAQPKPLYTLLVNTTLPVILYTGYLFEDISESVTSLCSIVVDGPFMQSLQVAGFPASSNQRVFFNTGRLSDQQIKDFITFHNMTSEPNFYENSANFWRGFWWII